ncbi:MAG: glycerate kinase [Oscillospiraceae bacterium]|nr:glycerate kinase [Oscillospiraceae bacterium]
MKKIILIPDSFKGTVTAGQFCSIGEKVLKKYFPSCAVISLPLADGGEGTTDCFLQMDGYEKINLTVKNAFMEDIPVYYARKGKTAVMEMAMCASLPQAKDRENPSLTTTYGAGQMIRHAVENGAAKIIIGLGGSSTNDAGAGMAAALGVKFYDDKNNDFIPTGGTLDTVKYFDITECKKLLNGVEILAMCDIDNPLYGKNGAAYIFSPQKGADEAMVQQLDANLQHIAAVSADILDADYSNHRGAGAAGGMGFGVCAFLGGSLKPGVNLILEEINFSEEIKDADLVITGEGRIDSQSLSGKAVVGIARASQPAGVPVIAVVGNMTDGFEPAYEQGLTAVFSTNHTPQSMEQAAANAHANLEKTMENLARTISALSK